MALNGNPAPNGETYRLRLMEYIHVTNSVISGTSIFFDNVKQYEF
jgi:hypothetical protein